MEVENIRKRFWRLKAEEKGKTFDKKVNSLTRYKIGGTQVVVVVVVVPFFCSLFFFAMSKIYEQKKFKNKWGGGY